MVGRDLCVMNAKCIQAVNMVLAMALPGPVDVIPIGVAYYAIKI
uniref:Uncharacterized protein n=1 Tax=Glossina brevipalpis TaxID=37001 RepID=A0A1A9W7B9_9MUSC